MAVNPNVVVPQVQQAVQVPLPADDPALFGASLLAIGFNVDTIMFLGTHGMNTAKNFYFLPLLQFNTMIKNINQLATFPPAQQVRFPYAAVMGLKGFRAWFDYLASRGQTLDPSADPNLDLRIWIERLDGLARFAKSKDNKTLVGVPKFTSFKGWKAWDELMCTALRGVRCSITGVPYSFLDRLHTVVEPMMFLMVRNMIDDDLVATTSLLTASSRIDSCFLYDLLNPLFIGGEA
jgi:hypothetical protein